MKTILLTGVAGFVGQKTAQFLLRDGFQVVGIDNLNNYYDVNLKEYRLSQLNSVNGFDFYNIDIEDVKDLNSIMKDYKFEAIINLAARAGVRYSLENPNIYVSTNIQGSLNLLELSKKFKIEKFVLASTSSVYAGEKMPFKENLPVNNPISPYAATKKGAELMAYSFHSVYGIDISIVRYFTVYGPAGRPDMSIFRFIKWIDEGSKIKIYGDGTQSRDFTYIDDIAEGTIKALKKVGFEIINLGGGKNPVSLLTIIKMIEKRMNKKAKFEYNNFPKTDIQETWADIYKAKKLINWKPKIKLEEGINRTIDWYLENKRLVQKIKI
ncbi:MAG: nucleotide sugar epimerase [Candidatus Marinimicrobia bacterium]|nr:nucleotide sugar epimerase [Candidatus Neomarinimicrobiota bacterium]